jgi:hypothetical protein
MRRRQFISQAGILRVGVLIVRNILKAVSLDFAVVRAPKSERKFISDAIEKVILEMKNKLKDTHLI